MSFDLYFYTSKGHDLPRDEIASYLEKNGCVREGGFPQWVYTNEATGVYFIFEIQADSSETEDFEIFESFSEYDNTRFSFSLNFVRLNYFGLEAFAYVEKFMRDLDLYALDLQSAEEQQMPRRAVAEEYYAEWSVVNLKFSGDHFDEFGLIHIPIQKSNQYWRYNFNKDKFQEELGEEYFVPRLILALRNSTGEPITVSTWTQHIPNVFPPADFFVLNRKRRKLFRTIDESGIISCEKFFNTFGDFLEPFELENCYIIRPDKAAAVESIFNSIEFDFELGGFWRPLEQNLTNAERTSEQTRIESN